MRRIEKRILLRCTIEKADYAPVNIEHMRTFLEVAATANFNRAAERLHVSQSTVSARVKALEEQLDRKLFVRAAAAPS